MKTAPHTVVALIRSAATPNPLEMKREPLRLPNEQDGVWSYSVTLPFE
jgi:hypothetical protein